MDAEKIVELRNRIGKEYLVMANSFDNRVIRECAQRMEMIAQELMEACEEVA